jgi:hypothetical protein
MPLHDARKPAVVWLNRNDLFVPSIGTGVLIRHVCWPMQISCTRGGRGIFREQDFEPGRPPDIAWRPFQFFRTTCWRDRGSEDLTIIESTAEHTRI